MSRRELWRIIDELVDEQGIGVLVATSYLDEAARCSRVILLDGGELLATGPPADFPLALGGRVWELRPAPGCLPRGVQTALEQRPDRARDAAERKRADREALSERERQVLDLVLAGQSSRQVALRLFISPKTVEFHRARIMQKLGVHSAAQLFRRCL